MKTLAIYSIKGGVGKTSTAVNLAYLAAESGLRTLLWDLDPQAAATYLFRVRPRVKGGSASLVTGRREAQRAVKATDYECLDLLPADFSYRHMDLDLDAAKKPTRRLAAVLREVRDDYDLVVLDCPPSISLVSENVFHAADLLLVPLVPAPLSLRTVDQLNVVVGELDRDRRPQLRVFFSMVDRRKRLHTDVMSEVTAQRGGVLSAAIPNSADVERMGDTREPVAARRSRAADAYAELWRQSRQLLGL